MSHWTDAIVSFGHFILVEDRGAYFIQSDAFWQQFRKGSENTSWWFSRSTSIRVLTSFVIKERFMLCSWLDLVPIPYLAVAIRKSQAAWSVSFRSVSSSVAIAPMTLIALFARHWSTEWHKMLQFTVPPKPINAIKHHEKRNLNGKF